MTIHLLAFWSTLCINIKFHKIYSHETWTEVSQDVHMNPKTSICILPEVFYKNTVQKKKKNLQKDNGDKVLF